MSFKFKDEVEDAFIPEQVGYSRSTTLLYEKEVIRHRSNSFLSALYTPGSLEYLRYVVNGQHREVEAYLPIVLYYSEMIKLVSSATHLHLLPTLEASFEADADVVEAQSEIQEQSEVASDLDKVTSSVSVQVSVEPSSKSSVRTFLVLQAGGSPSSGASSLMLVVKEEWQPQEVFAGNYAREGNVNGTFDPEFCFQVDMYRAHTTCLLHHEQEIVLDHLTRKRTFKQISYKQRLSISRVREIYWQSLEKLSQYVNCLN
jgi:hypothetical protein